MMLHQSLEQSIAGSGDRARRPVSPFGPAAAQRVGGNGPRGSRHGGRRFEPDSFDGEDAFPIWGHQGAASTRARREWALRARERGRGDGEAPGPPGGPSAWAGRPGLPTREMPILWGQMGAGPFVVAGGGAGGGYAQYGSPPPIFAGFGGFAGTEENLLRAVLEQSRIAHLVGELPCETYQKDRHGQLTECEICLVDYEVGDELMRLPCLHLFHSGCIVPWLRKAHTCPLCQTDVMEATGLS